MSVAAKIGSRFILSAVANFARQHLNSFKVLFLQYCVSLFVKVFHEIAHISVALVVTNAHCRVGRMVGKRGKHCCEMIYQLDSLSLNSKLIKSSKKLALGIGNLLEYFTLMLTSFTSQSANAVCF